MLPCVRVKCHRFKSVDFLRREEYPDIPKRGTAMCLEFGQL
jgi:hypothetical protein